MPWHISEGEPLWIDPANTGRMSSQQLAEYSQRQQRDRVLNDEIARADTCTREDAYGLIPTITLDRTKREITEFELAPGRTKRDGWMAPYTTTPQRAMIWNTNGKSSQMMKALAQDAVATERAIAKGTMPVFSVAKSLADVGL